MALNIAFLLLLCTISLTKLLTSGHSETDHPLERDANTGFSTLNLTQQHHNSHSLNTKGGKDRELKHWIDVQIVRLAGTSYGPTTSSFPSFLSDFHSSTGSSTHSPSDCVHTAQRSQISILLIGDSISRLLVGEWCEIRGGKIYPQFHSNLMYERGAHEGNGACVWNNITIGFVHVFGSQQEGLYGRGYSYDPADDTRHYIDTKVRIPQAIKKFSELFGKPTFVLFRTDLWDMIPILFEDNTPSENERPIGENRTEIVKHWIEKQYGLIDFIREQLPHAYIGSHTVPDITWGRSLFNSIENAARYISHVKGTFLIDWNMLMRHFVNFEHLRDNHHPEIQHCVLFTDLMTTLLQDWACIHPVKEV